MESILQHEKECYLCGRMTDLEEHHVIFGNPNRKNSEKYGLKVWLCAEHHRGNEGPHHRRDVDVALKIMAQTAFEARYGDRDDFRRVFGKSWL